MVTVQKSIYIYIYRKYEQIQSQFGKYTFLKATSIMVRVQHGHTAGTLDVMISEAKAKHYGGFLTGQQEMSSVFKSLFQLHTIMSPPYGKRKQN
jgi:hypothetical protein